MGGRTQGLPPGYASECALLYLCHVQCSSHFRNTFKNAFDESYLGLTKSHAIDRQSLGDRSRLTCWPPLAYIISRNFHCDAIIPVVKLFWCVALEPMAGSKCKPGQGQWALKLESCCDVIQRLFSTTMAGQDNVSVQKAFLEENGCNACRYSAYDVIILSHTGQLA